MRDFFSWNFSLPWRVAGVRVRVHLLFPLLAGVVLVVAWKGSIDQACWWGAFLLVLLFSTLLHELGHCQEARRRGGMPHEVVLWPLGGLVQINVPRSARNEIAVALAGPLVNMVIAAVAAVGLLVVGVTLDAATFNLLVPPVVAGSLSWAAVVQLVVWANLWLLVLNLVPALPMDGGRAVRGLLWATLGRRRAIRYAHRSAQMTGVALCCGPTALRMLDMPAAWLVEVVLLGLGVFLLLATRPEERPRRRRREELPSEEERRDGEGEFALGIDNSLGLSAAIGQAVEPRLEDKLRQQRELEEQEDRQVDEILARLGEAGLEGLSAEERELLERVSARYRETRRGGDRETR